MDKDCETNPQQERNIMDCGPLGLGPNHSRIQGINYFLNKNNENCLH